MASKTKYLHQSTYQAVVVVALVVFVAALVFVVTLVFLVALVLLQFVLLFFCRVFNLIFLCRRMSRREHRSHDDRDRNRSSHRSSKHHRDRSRERRR